MTPRKKLTLHREVIGVLSERVAERVMGGATLGCENTVLGCIDFTGLCINETDYNCPVTAVNCI
jgi:hypothetical protein